MNTNTGQILLYKGQKVGVFVPDLIVFEAVVVEQKSSIESLITNEG
jgi:hypothetical protein